MPTTKRTLIQLLLVGIVFVVVIIFVYFYYWSPTGVKARRSSDIFALNAPEKAMYQTLDGETIDLLNDKGTPLLVTVWASWSPYTNADFSALEIIKQKFGDKIRIVALNRMEPKETAQAFLNSIDSSSELEYILDANDFFFKTVGGYAMPETILFDRVGNIYTHLRGSLNPIELENSITELLKQ